MKYFFSLFIALLFNQFTFSQAQTFHDTQGKFEVSQSGQATFTVPIALPPSIQDVGPTINLVYASGQMGGIAGQGWNISSISNISRIATRIDIDGFVDGVDFDDNDKLALDGQRLIIKTGNYWENGSTYETEVQSNTKIRMSSVTTFYTNPYIGTVFNYTIISFDVTFPDGSISTYGGSGASDLTAFYINKFQDTKGNEINYNYISNYNCNYIDEIFFSLNSSSNPQALNKIKFNYVISAKEENSLVNYELVRKTKILNNIEVFTNNQLFKRYQLTHFTDNLGYQRVTQIQEYNGVDVVGANPIQFEYNNLNGNITSLHRQEYFADIPINSQLSADFNGDGHIDYIKNNQMYFNTLGTSSGPILFTFPFTFDDTFAIKTLINNRLYQKSSILKISNNGQTLSTYNESGFLLNTKSINLNTILPNIINYCTINSNLITTNFSYPQQIKYLTGDFNGDGLSELFIYGNVDAAISYSNHEIMEQDPDDPHNTIGTGVFECLQDNVYSGSYLRIVDLNPNTSTVDNSIGNTLVGNNYWDNTGKKFVQDFNRDGKDDILTILDNGYYRIHTFNQNNQAPFQIMDVLGQGYLNMYDPNLLLLFGDFNGDGFVDMMSPRHLDMNNWNIYYSYGKGFSYDLSFFSQTYAQNTSVQYHPYAHAADNRWQDWQYYFAIDVDKDGKDELVNLVTSSWVELSPYTGAILPKSRWQIRTYAINGTSFNLIEDTGEPNNVIDNNNRIIPISGSQKKGDLVYDLVLQQGESANSWGNLYYIKFNKSVFINNHLSRIIQSNGSIIDEIFYKPMNVYSPSYSSGFDQMYYPNAEINTIPSLNLVDYVKNTSLSISKFQDFRYFGYTCNYYGLGVLGFQKTARSNWYVPDSTKKIWSVVENDYSKRGALIRTFTKMLNRTEYLTFYNSYINLMSKTENEYNPPSPPNTFPYVLTLNKQTTTDYLTNVIQEKIFNYSTDGFYLPIQQTTNNYLGTVLQGSTYTKTEFCPNNFGIGSAYYIGRPDNTKTVTTAYGDTKSNYSKLSYLGSNVSQIEKRVGTTEASLLSATERIFENMDYFPNGNLRSKTLSATGFADNGSPRTTSFTYDITNRFVKTITDVELLVTTNNSYDPRYGTVTSQTNPFGQTTTKTIDNWGKPLSITDFLTKSITYQYSRINNESISQQTGSDGSVSALVNDVLGRTIRKGSLDLNNNFNYIKTDYDWKGQAIRVSEPYLNGTSTNLFSTSEYDDYGRTIRTTDHTGQITTITYTGLTTTVYDGKITNVTTKNANGHVINTIETADGSTPNNISYSYNANGNLLNSSYGTIGMSSLYDFWGRKTSLIDPSAGTTTYTYNAYGELKTEINPKGATTTITYNAVGKPLTKLEYSTVAADATNILTTYNYDATRKWLNSMTVVDPNSGNSTFNYNYDTLSSIPTFQLKETIENQTTLGPKFTKTLAFDSFGRVLTETNKAEMAGKTSLKTTFNVYVNGFLKEIKENSLTGTSIWKTETVNPRGQLNLGTFGNGIEELNSYDLYGYFSQKKHKKLGLDLLKIDYEFNELRGNLKKRTNSFCNFIENFEFDSSDRLNKWETPYLIVENNFNTSIGTFENTGCLLSLINNALQVRIPNTISKVRKLLLSTAVIGKSYKVTADLANNQISGSNIYTIYEAENNSITAPRINKNVNINEKFTISSYNNIYIEFFVTDYENSNCTIVPGLCNTTYDADGIPNTVCDPDIETCNPYTVGGGGDIYIDNLNLHEIVTTIQNYDNRGRITDNELGGYGYPASGKIYQNNRIKLLPEAQPFYLVDRTSQTITYNAFKCPIDIFEAGKERISFGYNAMHDRSVMYYGSTNTNRLLRPFRKYYSADGAMEIKYTLAAAATATTPATPASYEFSTYLGGDAYSAPAVIKSNGINQNIFYLHRDNQNSILAVSNSVGTIIERRFFDAWGQLARFEKNGIEVASGSLNSANGLFLDRGYTGHEHLLGVGLINMNARLYDSKLRRFLQTDNEVQDPSKAQDYNRYGYCNNNPLKFTDPSGNNPIVIGIILSMFIYTATTISNNGFFNIPGLLQAAIIGGFSSAVSFGIGEAVSTIGNFWLKTGIQIIAHSASQGQMTSMQGGNFWNGAASGALSSLASSLWAGGDVSKGQWGGLVGSNGASMIVFGTIAGGVGASLTGGNFWQGAVTGLIVSGLNHAMHPGRKSLLSRFKNKAFAKEAPDFSDAGLVKMHEGVEGLQGAYEAGGQPSVNYDNEDMSTKATTVKGNVSVNKIIMQYQTNLEYAGVLFHEYRHAFQFITPYMGYKTMVSAWQSLYGNGNYVPVLGETLGGYLSAMEYDAYAFQYRMGDNASYVIKMMNYKANQIRLYK